MKLKKGFILHDVGGEHMGIASDESDGNPKEFVRNNGTANFIFHMLLNETTEQAIVDAMTEKYDASEELIASDVNALINQLREAGLIDE